VFKSSGEKQMKRITAIVLLITLCVLKTYSAIGGIGRSYTYAVVVKNSTYNDPEWKQVADTLLSIHNNSDARLFTYTSSVTELQSELSDFMPEYIAFVCKPVTDVTRKKVQYMTSLVRHLDEDPYYDAVYGIVTGYVAADALRSVTDTLRIKTGLNETDGPIMSIKTGPINGTPSVTYVHHASGNSTTQSIGDDRIPFIANTLTEGVDITVGGIEYKAPIDIFGTGGHGTVNAWQAHYPDIGSEGFLRSENGQLYGLPNGAAQIPINKTTPTVYLAINNCLIGKPDDINNMVYAWSHTGGSVFMFGYLVNTSASHSGFSTRTRMTMEGITPAEAYFLSQNNYVWTIETAPDSYSKNHNIGHWPLTGFSFNLKETVVYGDPKANVYVNEGDGTSYSCGGIRTDIEDSVESGTGYITYTITMTKETDNLAPYSGWQRDARPVIPLPHRIKPETVEILQDDSYSHVVVDNLVAIRAWDRNDIDSAVGFSKVLKWRAELINKDIDPQDTVPQDTVPQDTVPQDTVPQDTVPQDTVPQDTISTNITNKSTVELHAGIDIALLNNNSIQCNIQGGNRGVVMKMVNLRGQVINMSTGTTNSEGKILFQLSNNGMLSKGVYFCNVTSGNTSVTRKIVIGN